MDEVLKLLLADIETAVDRLMEIAPQVWAVNVMQVRIVAIQDVLWSLFAIGSSVASYRGFRWALKGYRKEDEWHFGCWDIGVGLFVTVIVVFVTAAFILLLNAIGRFLNPNYYAIVAVFHMIKGD